MSANDTDYMQPVTTSAGSATDGCSKHATTGSKTQSGQLVNPFGNAKLKNKWTRARQRQHCTCQSYRSNIMTVKTGPEQELEHAMPFTGLLCTEPPKPSKSLEDHEHEGENDKAKTH